MKNKIEKKKKQKVIGGVDMEKAREEYIKVAPNVRLHITDAGEGKPIILIHGWPLSDEMFEYQYNDLVTNNFRVIGITLRGFGKSDKPYGPYDYDVHAADIKRVLDKLDIEDAVLCGFSMGGAIALRFVSKYTEPHISKLVLAAAAAPSWTRRPDFPFNLPMEEVDELIRLNYKDRPKLLANFAKIFSAEEDTLNDGMAAWLNGIGLSASSHATAACLAALRDTDLRNDLPRIQIPTLILHGKKDKICSFDLAQQMETGIPNAQLIAFEASGHSLFLEEVSKFNSALIAFAQ
jgi:pimeloyl-ACP methyl ester carboxylesterase